MSCGVLIQFFALYSKVNCVTMLSLARLQIKQIGVQISRYQSCKIIPVRWYRAAILEEFDKPLIVADIKNDTPLGMSIVNNSIKQYVNFGS